MLHLAAWQFGLLTTAFGVGGIAGSFLGVRLDARTGRRLGWAFGSMAVFGLAIVAMGFAPGPLWLGTAYFVLGLSFTVTEVVTAAVWQRLVPDQVRGRVMSTVGSLARTANPVGYVLAGWLGASIGTRGGLIAGGDAVLLLTAFMVLLGRVRALGRSLVTAMDPAMGS